jgi:hypothetical protein
MPSRPASAVAIAARHAIREAADAPVRPHRVEEVFVERDQIAAPL